MTITVRLLACGLVLLVCRCAWAEQKEFNDSFDGLQPSWNARYGKSASLLQQRRNKHIRLRGPRCENLEFEVLRSGAVIQLEHHLPAARRIDDLKLSLWFRSNRPGAQLSMRVVFPHHEDPSTRRPLQRMIAGAIYTSPDSWQQLKCSALSKRIRELIIRVRAELRQPNIDARGLYIDLAVITARVESGTVEMFIDDMKFGPIVTPRNAGELVQASNETNAGEPRVEFRSGRLLVDGRPFFMRMAPIHSESADQLQNAGFNSIWIPDFRDKALLQELSQRGLWAIATPPRVVNTSGKALNARDAGLVPFSRDTAPILAWILGTRIPTSATQELIDWSNQTRSADGFFRRRIMADVAGSVRISSRHVGMLGVSRHVVNTTMDFRQYRNWLKQKRLIARPGSYLWTWIQTEPAAANSRWREEAGRIPIVIEPEQIRLQVYAALSAESRGLGFWKTKSIDSDSPGALERRLVLEQLNMEIGLFEPFLATGKTVAKIKFTVASRSERRVGQRRLDFRDTEPELREGRSLLLVDKNRMRRRSQRSDELEATVFRSDYGALVLAVWYQRDAQFVPRKLAANNAKMIVPNVDETASAWEVSTTRIRSLSRKTATGGPEITLPRFDQTAAVIFTSDQNLITEIREKIKRIAPRSARVSVELARATLERTSQVSKELEELGHGWFDAPQLLAKAEMKLREAEAALAREDGQSYHEARILSGDVMQLLRILQSGYWDEAVEALGSPVASPFTTCFHTLPDHWRMIDRLGRSTYMDGGNLLRSGDFEDRDTMVVAGWKHSQDQIEGIRADADLYPVAQQGKRCLRLYAVPPTGEDPLKVVTGLPVSVKTPSMPVRAGQILHISGWVKVVSPITGDLNGAMLYDNLLGPTGALRWSKKDTSWQRFTLVREAHRSGDFFLTISLTGLGIIQFDDIRVIPHTPTPSRMAAGSRPNVAKPDPDETRFDFWNRLPRLRLRREQKDTPVDPQHDSIPARPAGNPQTDENPQPAKNSQPTVPKKLFPRITPRFK